MPGHFAPATVEFATASLERGMAMPPSSAGILLFRFGTDGALEVLLGHMGGPFWARKDRGGWSIPKGEHEPDEDPVTAARREFAEELGAPVGDGDLLELGTVRLPSGKLLSVWAAQGQLDVATVVSNTFELEWPKGSGRVQEFPEIDRAGWFAVETARDKLVKSQAVFLDRLVQRLR
jgi:predicted NUDIX family NTP pyrophosphohydrolase